jgi:anti-sigma B factor antagonist
MVRRKETTMLTIIPEETTLVVDGELDLYTTPVLKESLLELARNGQSEILLDLAHVSSLDSTAVWMLLGAKKSLAEVGTRLRVARASQRVQKILHILGVDDWLSQLVV